MPDIEQMMHVVQIVAAIIAGVGSAIALLTVLLEDE